MRPRERSQLHWMAVRHSRHPGEMMCGAIEVQARRLSTMVRFPTVCRSTVAIVVAMHWAGPWISTSRAMAIHHDELAVPQSLKDHTRPPPRHMYIRHYLRLWHRRRTKQLCLRVPATRLITSTSKRCIKYRVRESTHPRRCPRKGICRIWQHWRRTRKARASRNSR